MADSTGKFNIVSADGHTMEPPHVWERFLPERFHSQMPKLIKDPEVTSLIQSGDTLALLGHPRFRDLVAHVASR